MSSPAEFRRRRFEREYLLPQIGRFVAAAGYGNARPEWEQLLDPNRPPGAGGGSLPGLTGFEGWHAFELIQWLRLGLQCGYFAGPDPQGGDITYADLLLEGLTHIRAGHAEFELGLLGNALEYRLSDGSRYQVARPEPGKLWEAAIPGSEDIHEFDTWLNMALDDITGSRRHYLWAVWPFHGGWDAYVEPIQLAIAAVSEAPGTLLEPVLIRQVDARIRGRHSGLAQHLWPSAWRADTAVSMWAGDGQVKFDKLVDDLNTRLLGAASQSGQDRGVDRPSLRPQHE